MEHAKKAYVVQVPMALEIAVAAGYTLVEVGCERSSPDWAIAGLRCIVVRQAIGMGRNGSSLGQDHEMSHLSGDVK